MKTMRILPSVGLVAALLAGCGQTSEQAADSSSMTDADPTSARGYQAVGLRQCGQCHQSPDPRDGILSGRDVLQGTEAHGPNLTPDPDTGMDAWDADAIANAVLAGVDERGNRLCPVMPAFADAGMGHDEAIAIAVYLQGLIPVRHVVPPNACTPVNPAKD